MNTVERSETLTTPTKPQPKGMMAMLPATVWTRTFSTGENGNLRCLDKSLKKPKPIKLAGMVIVLTQPVWRPKYMLEKQMTRPTRSPTRMPRSVKLWPWVCGGIRYAWDTKVLGDGVSSSVV